MTGRAWRAGAWMAGIGLGMLLGLLVMAADARAAKYSVAQCGWYVGADADWADTTGGAKFRPDAYCVPPPGADPFDGMHMKSFTRGTAATVSGTRFARWRWSAPAGTGIVNVRGTWWHALHDGMEQRLGVGRPGGGFDVFAAAAQTDVSRREFAVGFWPPRPFLEDRLLCARGESKWCSLSPTSWSSLRALTITLQDDAPPAAGIGGQILSGGWRRGTQAVSLWGGDAGGGIRFGDTSVDGVRVDLTEYPCAKAMIGGEWRGTRMRPCELSGAAARTIDTRTFSDGPHSLGHCVTDFAGNVACTPLHQFLIDNNPPAHPRQLRLAGGDGWRRVNDFDLVWANPDQGRASPVNAASWRITGPAGYDSGVKMTSGRGIAALGNLRLPRPGAYAVRVWLRDEAGNEDPRTAVELPLRLDDVAPGVAFGADSDPVRDGVLRASVSDDHSGPASGTLHYRPVGGEEWIELPTKLERGAEGAELVAPLPRDRLAPGSYLFRADAADAAGNTASTTRRADGTLMVARKERVVVPPRAKTRLFARLRWKRRLASSVTVPFRGRALLTGRLVRADGAGIGGRVLRVVARPSRGALARAKVLNPVTGPHGGFRLPLPPGPSRRVSVSFAGDAGLEGAIRPNLGLRVRASLTFHAAPRRLVRGRVLRIRGRVRALGAPLPRRGKLVAIQYLEAATKRWRPVLVTRTDHHGRYRARYRFRYVRGTARIRMRAVAFPEERWPYAPGVSRRLTIRVRG